ncbi:MAG: hypothetical protein ACI808_001814, partial [Paraglaciecola sp.]
MVCSMAIDMFRHHVSASRPDGDDPGRDVSSEELRLSSCIHILHRTQLCRPCITNRCVVVNLYY